MGKKRQIEEDWDYVYKIGNKIAKAAADPVATTEKMVSKAVYENTMDWVNEQYIGIKNSTIGAAYTIYNELSEKVEQSKQRSDLALCKKAFGDACEGKKQIEHKPSSQSNSTETPQAEGMSGQDDTAPGGSTETCLDPVHDVWSKHPNHQWAKLHFNHFYRPDDRGIISVANQAIDGDQGYSSVAGNATTAATTTLINTQVGSLFSSVTWGINAGAPHLFQYRLTSPYDICYNLNQSITSTAQNANYSQPAWLEKFDQMYQYYHQKSIDYSLRLVFGGLTDSTNFITSSLQTKPQNYGYYVFWRVTCQDDPPVSWSTTALQDLNETTVNQGENATTNTVTGVSTTVATVPLTPHDYMTMGGWQHKRVTLNAIAPTEVTIEGTYEFGQSQLDVKTLLPTDKIGAQSVPTVEGWQLCGSTPVFPENLSVIIVADLAYAGFSTQVGTYFSQICMEWNSSHLVEFKDLNKPYKFPTDGYLKENAGATTINQEILWFKRGIAN